MPSDVAVHSYTDEDQLEAVPTCDGDTGAPPGDSGGDAPVTRARVYGAEGFLSRFRARWGTPIAPDPDPPKRRNAWADDAPSPKRVCLDYCAAARVWCEGMPLLYPLYWLFSAPVLALNMFFKAGDNFTQRASYAYGVLVFVGIIAGIIALTHP